MKNATSNDGCTSSTTFDCVEYVNVTVELVCSPNGEFGKGVPIRAASRFLVVMVGSSMLNVSVDSVVSGMKYRVSRLDVCKKSVMTQQVSPSHTGKTLVRDKKR